MTALMANSRRSMGRLLEAAVPDLQRLRCARQRKRISISKADYASRSTMQIARNDEHHFGQQPHICEVC